MKSLLIPFAAVMLFIIAVGIFIKKTGNIPLSETPKTSATVTIGTKTVNVELAKTAEEKSKGLSGRKSLDENSGMLFVFGKDDKSPTFWMKDMQIHLDMIWIQGSSVIRIDKNVPIPDDGTPDSKLIIYSAGVKVDYVLEVNSGFSDSNSLQIGDIVTTSGI